MTNPTITAAMVARGRTLADPKLSPDGTRVAFLTRAAGVTALAVAPAAGGPERLVAVDPPPAMAHPTGGGVVDWVDPQRLVYAAADGTLQLVPASGGPGRTLVRWGEVGDVAASPSVPGRGGALVAFTIGERDLSIVGVDAALAGETWPVRVPGRADFVLDPAWSPDGTRLAWHEWDDPSMPWDASRIVTCEMGSGALEVEAGGPGTAVAQPRFAPDGTLGWLTDESGHLGLWCHADGAEHAIASWGSGIRSWAWSPDGRQLAFVRNEDGFGRLCVLDRTSGTVRELGKGWHHGLTWRAGTIAAIRGGARTPSQVVAYEAGSGERRVLAHSDAGGFGDHNLVEPEPVTWTALDGGPVHGRLYRPTPKRRGVPPPLLLWVHGGPTDQTRVDWHPAIAWFVDRGWAVLVADYRGSAGWGRAYQQALNGEWGALDVADCAAGLRAAAERGWADPRSMVPIGASAGGFTVVHLLARHPDLCAAGVARYPVSDLLDLGERTHRFEAHYNDILVGPLPAAADVQRARSPIHHADRITAPLLVVHGEADRVVPVEQSRALAGRVPTVEYHEYAGEGHGWRRTETVEDELARIGDFLRRHVLRWRA